MNDKQYKIHVSEVEKLSKRSYFTKISFDADSIVSEAFILLAERGVEYNQDLFFKTLRSVMAKENYERIKSHKYLYKLYLEKNRDFKKKERKNAGVYYIKKLLSRHYTLDEMKANPQLIDEKRKEILNLRKNNNQPIENELPPIPPELIDLSLIKAEYKGYGITMQGELYSCKALFKTDVMFTTQWRPIAKRKNGCIRLNIKGVKKELGINSVLKEIQKAAIINNKENI